MKTALAGPLSWVGTIFFSLTFYFLSRNRERNFPVNSPLSNDSQPKVCFWPTQPETQNQKSPLLPPLEKWPLRKKVERESLLRKPTEMAQRRLSLTQKPPPKELEDSGTQSHLPGFPRPRKIACTWATHTSECILFTLWMDFHPHALFFFLT